MELNSLMVEVTDLGIRVKRVLEKIQESKLVVKSWSTDGTNSRTVDFRLEQLNIYVDFDNRAQFIVEDFVELARPAAYPVGDEYGMLVVCTRPRYNNNARVAESHLVELLVYTNNNQYGKLTLDGFIALLCQLLSADKIGNSNFGRYWLEQGLYPRRYEVSAIHDGSILHSNLTNKLLFRSLLIGLDEIK